MIQIKESPISRQFAACLQRIEPMVHEAVIWAAKLTSMALDTGQVCIDLNHYAGIQIASDFYLPECKAWKALLNQSILVGEPFEFKPLILEGDKLYLARYWRYEHFLAEDLKLRAQELFDEIDLDQLQVDLDRLFSHNRQRPDLQKAAATIALLRQFCVISGGPGTGKTSTVVRIIALLQAQGIQRIALAAPTGKAALRMSESIRIQKLNFPKDISIDIPEKVTTLHRLLGSRYNSSYFFHGKENPLALDVLVVDEASMIDLALMAKLLAALPTQARLILLGDKDQLSAVEAGSVLGDICANIGYSEAFKQRIHRVSGVELESNKAKPLADSIAILTHSHRFETQSGIGALALAINSGDINSALNLLESNQFLDIAWQEGIISNSLVLDKMEQAYMAYFDGVKKGLDAKELLNLFDRFRVLTAHREGLMGAMTLNYLFENRLKRRFSIDSELLWYPGRPVIINRNDYSLKLFNGDIGICLKIENDFKVFFEDADGQLRKFNPNRIPDHSTVYAMTTHKSQGSEFDEVLFLLPDMLSPILDRPLIYTAITRAKQKLNIWGKVEVFKAAISKIPEQSSGLKNRLWE